MLLRRLYRAISRRDYDQLRALEPGLGLARLLWRSKELRARQPLHDFPPMVGWWLAHHDQILPLITAISWHAKPTCEKESQRPLSHFATRRICSGAFEARWEVASETPQNSDR